MVGVPDTVKQIGTRSCSSADLRGSPAHLSRSPSDRVACRRLLDWSPR
ncbi:hypothetical protein QJS66_20495 [Kocuria rhizophila]|nr:hypothetical protein QJS66_20495 [Kocuria rhizophila]